MTPLSQNSVVGVIGAGTMGAGIAQVAAQAGHKVYLYDAQSEAAALGIQGIDKQLTSRVSKGKLGDSERLDVLDRLVVADELSSLADCALVIEAIVEDITIKQQVFTDLEKICAGKTILATNTSSLSVTAIASALERPENFIGLHFFNPAPVLKLVEVVRGLATSESTADTAFATVAAWGKTPVFARNTPGFIVNRVARPFYAEALNLLEQQATDPVTLDALMRECGGFRMGPCQLMDMIGHDVNVSVTRSVFSSFNGDPRYRPSLIQQELVDAGRLGRKTGQGFYNYAESGDQPVPMQAPKEAVPTRITIETHPENGLLLPLAKRFEAAGITVNVVPGHGRIQVRGCSLALADGRLATERSVIEGDDDLILFDLALDYGSATRIALAAADTASGSARRVAAGLFQSADMQVSWLDDVPGLVVLRTVAMLVNEGATAINEGICDAASVDDAMRYGVNYPLGPLAWADQLNPRFVLRVLQNLQSCYGDDRYRPSPRLRRIAAVNGRFHP